MKRRRWLGRLIIIVAVLAALGLALSAALFSAWSESEPADEAAATAAFAAALAGCEDPRPYLWVEAGGAVRVDRGLEEPVPSALGFLHLLLWDAGSEQLLRIDLPWWFVRMKFTRSMNLGTLTTALAGDWEHLDLRVSDRDLEHRGPGLVLDHRPSGGRRLMLWTARGGG